MNREAALGIFLGAATLAALAGTAVGGSTWRVCRGDFSAHFQSIQAAISSPTTVSGDTIEVDPAVDGTPSYTEVIDFFNKDLALVAPGDPVVLINNTSAPAHTAVVTIAGGQTNASTLINFVIQRAGSESVRGIEIMGASPSIGFCEITGLDFATGAGVYIDGGEPGLWDSRIVGNHAETSGGGVYVASGTPRFQRCTIEGNTAGVWGGGIYYLSTDAQSRIVLCDIFLNSAINGGGGIYAAGGDIDLYMSTVQWNSTNGWGGGVLQRGGLFYFNNSDAIENTAFHGGGCMVAADPGEYPQMRSKWAEFTGNTAEGDGGGLALRLSASALLEDTKILDNLAGERGGGVFAWHSSDGSFAAVRTRFGRNATPIPDTTPADSSGGAIAAIGAGPVDLVSCILDNNAAGRRGGAVHAASDTLNAAPVTLVNCQITECTAPQGAAISIRTGNSDVRLLSSSVALTIADDDPNSPGGAILHQSGWLTMRNSIVYNISPPYWLERPIGGPDADVAYCDLQGRDSVPGYLYGPGVIDADPLFTSVAPGTVDLRLTTGSPCIDAGDYDALPTDAYDLDGDSNPYEPLPLDLAGVSRLIDDPVSLNTGTGEMPWLDFGAYEYALSVPCTQADMAQPYGVLDLADISTFVHAFIGSDLAADFNGDGILDLSDLMAFINSFLAGCP
jgi:hypothetical protein